MIKKIAILIFLTSCARQTIHRPDQALRKINTNIELQDDLAIEPLLMAIKNNIKVIKNKKNRTLTFGPLKINSYDYAKELEALTHVKNKSDFIKLVKNNFYILEVYGKDKYGQILLTSYYEPIIHGSLKRTPKHSQPIYQVPDDLVEIKIKKFANSGLGNFKVNRKRIGARIIKNQGRISSIVPYYSRSEIDSSNTLAKKQLELAYLDPIEAFFLQIQGSGTIQLNSGRITVGYGAQNGWRYTSIGKHLTHIIPREEMSLQKIENYLRTLSPSELQKILNLNQSYIFFKKLETRPITSLGVEVVNGRTLAIDASLFPLGSLAFLNFASPQFSSLQKLTPEKTLETSRFVVATDTGGAIKGPGRADLFWGSGKRAKQRAGFMRHSAKLYFFVPKTAKSALFQSN